MRFIGEDPEIEFTFLSATEHAAISAARCVGRGDKNAVDGAAVEAMRERLRNAPFSGVVRIGEGEKDEAPMLFIGERLGVGGGAFLDVAVDPVDGTTLASKGGPGAISVVAAARADALFGTRVPYMDKIVVGRGARGTISFDRSPAENARAIAAALGHDVTEITVAVQDRPRNAAIVEDLRAVGARIRLFGDGDVAMSLMALLPDEGRVDALMGIGGAPEGVVTACAVRALGGDMLGRLWLRDRDDYRICVDEDRVPEVVLTLDDLCASEETFFVATGVTDGELLAGVKARGEVARTQSLLISSYTHTIRRLESVHTLESTLTTA